MSDPFKNDSFFGGGLFDRANDMMKGMMDFGSKIEKGQFMKKTYHQIGDDIYQTKAHGAIGGGHKVVDRQ